LYKINLIIDQSRCEEKCISFLVYKVGFIG